MERKAKRRTILKMLPAAAVIAAPVARIPKADLLIAAGCAAAVVGVSAYMLLRPVGAQTDGSGPIRGTDDIPPEVQAVLRQADAPTHNTPTEWGLLLINPVINGEAIINVQEFPVPPFIGPEVVFDEANGEEASERLAGQGLRVIDVPEPYRKGMSVGAVRAITDRDQFYTIAYFESGAGTENYLSLEVEAYTPTAPVPVEEFPDNAIRDFRKSNAVRGNPTITVFPDTGTSSPMNERLVAWSQDGAVYFLRTTGFYPDEDLLAAAAHISETEERR